MQSSVFMFLFLLTYFLVSPLSYAGLTQEELDDFQHMSIGADVFPYDWFIRLKSSRDKDITGNWNTYLKDNLDQRASAHYDSYESKYLSGVIGLSVTWSGHGAVNPEALKSDAEMAQTKIGQKAPIRYVNGSPSIRMLGTTCVACHTGNLQTDKNNYLVHGGQSNLSLDWLLRDMVVTTLGLMFNIDNQLKEFLISFGYEKDQSKKLANKFKKDTMHELRFTTKMILAAKKLKLIADLPHYVFAKEEKGVANRLKALLRLTLHLKEGEELGNELEKRMEFIAMLVSGTPRKTFKDGKWSKYSEVQAGYGRVDAFNNAFNKLLRPKNQKVNLRAPVGYPPIWKIQNKYLLHYTGNTNSVTHRNIGLASAAGAIILNDELDSTVNFENLYNIEKMVYKLDVPNWQKIFHKEDQELFKIDLDSANRGKKIFAENCLGCHSPKKVHTGYLNPLFEYPLISQEKLGTDPELSLQIVKPLNPLSEDKKYPAAEYLKRTQGLLDAYFKSFNIPLKKQEELTFKEYRGVQWFKDVKREKPKGSYPARDLAGIWSTAPFLHNNSVPTLWDLLQKPAQRPKIFRVKLRHFDPVKVGLKNHNKDLENCYPKSKRDYKTDHHQCRDTSEVGSSNLGHDFGTDLNDSEKYDLIEYLKIIKPFEEERAPASVANGEKPETPFLDEFDNILLGKIPLIGKWLEKKDFLKHRLLTFKKWVSKAPDQMFEELRKYRPLAFVSRMPIKNFGAENTGLVIVSRHKDVIEVLENPTAFSVRHVGYKLSPLGGHMLGTDMTELNTVEKPWLRKLIPRSDYGKIAQLITQYTNESFKEIEKAQANSKRLRMNIVNELGRKVSARLFKNYFGFSGPTLEHLYKWSYWIQKDTFRNPTNKTKVREEAMKIELELLAFMNDYIAKLEEDLKKNKNQPINNTILERMILSEEIKSGKIKKDRIALNMIGMLGASIDTIQIALVKSVEFFIKNPEILKEAAEIAKSGDTHTLQKYVMESLRLNPASPLLIRYTEKDTKVAEGTNREVVIPKGTSILLGTYSAMRDIEVVNDPYKFDINRPESNYFLFGHGHHKCLGDRLGEVELGIMISAIIQKSNLKYFNEDKKKELMPEQRFIEYDAKSL